jgi:hypothetical protein
MEPWRNDSCAGGEGVEVEGARRKPFDDFFDRALEIIEVERMSGKFGTAPDRMLPAKEQAARRRAPGCR